MTEIYVNVIIVGISKLHCLKDRPKDSAANNMEEAFRKLP
jgi:hypothetical protein